MPSATSRAHKAAAAAAILVKRVSCVFSPTKKVVWQAKSHPYHVGMGLPRERIRGGGGFLRLWFSTCCSRRAGDVSGEVRFI
jgi:hypothetical protein